MQAGNRFRRNRAATFALAGALAFSAAAHALEEAIDLDSERWVLTNGQIVEHLGRTCLTGSAYLEDVRFENGVIEVDVALTGARGYPGINLRVQSPTDYEHFYIRPHRMGLYPDALQYTPVFNGISGWQLYNGDGFTAAVEIPENEWVRLRLEVSRSQARLFIGDAEDPALEIPRLKHGTSRGSIGLSSQPGVDGYFSRFRYRTDDDLHFDPAVHPDRQELGALEWRAVGIEPSGLVNVGRVHGRTGREPDCVCARTFIDSPGGPAAGQGASSPILFCTSPFAGKRSASSR